jgi:CheY-like chemotaxis protein
MQPGSRLVEHVQASAALAALKLGRQLDALRLATGKLHVKPQPADLTEICQSAVDAVRVTAESKGIELQTKIPDSRVEVWADPTRVRQVLWNLLTNALKFTPQGGRVEVKIDVADSEISLSVRDTGEGIDPTFLPYIFERFRQADSSSSRKHGGLGLGLSIVRYLVETHGGDVKARSEGKGKGSEFIVTLPRPNIQSEAAAQTAKAEHSMPRQSLKGMKVLVVDDSPDLLTLVDYVLRAQGANVTTAGSASEGLLAFQTVRPRMVLSDVAMPDQDGYDLIHQIRAMEKEGPHVPAIALTAYAREDEKQRALEAGFHMHVSKPLQPEQLVSAIVELTTQANSALNT